MRNNVIFRHPAPFVRLSEEDGILSVAGADWFVALLDRVEGLTVDRKLIQEDWGVVIWAERGGKRFWIGVSFWDDQEWIAHFHHRSFAWLQRLKGNHELDRLIRDFHAMLARVPEVQGIVWHYEREMRGAKFMKGSPTPDAPEER